MDSLCRLCLAPNSGTTPLFDHQSMEPNLLLLQKILECTSVKLTVGDDFPSSVCSTCEEKLNELSTFKIQCIVNNDYYRKKQAELRKQLLARNQLPTEIVVLDDDDDDEEPPEKKQVEPPSKKSKVVEQVIIDDDDEEDEEEEEDDEEDESLAAINGQMAPMYHGLDEQDEEDDDYELELVEGQEYQDQWQPEQHEYGGYPEMDNNAILSSILLDDEESRSSMMTEVKYENYESRGDAFGCNFCGRRYSTELKLKTHEKLHTEGLKKCFICGKMIVLHLLRHMRSQHQGMNFPEPVRCWHTKCAGLKDAFYNVDQLLEHMDSKRTRK